MVRVYLEPTEDNVIDVERTEVIPAVLPRRAPAPSSPAPDRAQRPEVPPFETTDLERILTGLRNLDWGESS